MFIIDFQHIMPVKYFTFPSAYVVGGKHHTTSDYFHFQKGKTTNDTTIFLTFFQSFPKKLNKFEEIRLFFGTF